MRRVRRSSRGFSLLEMLLVLFVIVMLTSLVSLNMSAGDGQRALQQRIASLEDVVRYAMDEAQFSGRDFGLLLHRSGQDGGVRLVFRERLPQGWRTPDSAVDVFAPVDLGTDLELTLLLDGSAVTILPVEAGEELAGTVPQWLFLASGETQAGEMLWRRRADGELVGHLAWDALGRFERDDADALGETDAIARNNR